MAVNMILPPVDRDGHLRNLQDWSEAVAEALARKEGITMTPLHWSIIGIVRDFHRRTEVAPAMRPLVKLVRDQLGADIGNSLTLHELFPGSPARVIARIAGLPRPKSCL
jgi:tRNA 2-thiouridine synthesizing protein E